MKYYWPLAFHFEVSSASDDPQKLLTPGIVLTMSEDEEDDIAAGLIQIGWWHWSLDCYFAFIKT